jgi:hypothetical protein
MLRKGRKLKDAAAILGFALSAYGFAVLVMLF